MKPIKDNKKISRKTAAQALFELAKCYEVKISYSTVYKGCYFFNGSWHYSGHAHNYTF